MEQATQTTDKASKGLDDSGPGSETISVLAIVGLCLFLLLLLIVFAMYRRQIFHIFSFAAILLQCCIDRARFLPWYNPSLFPLCVASCGTSNSYIRQQLLHWLHWHLTSAGQISFLTGDRLYSIQPFSPPISPVCGEVSSFVLIQSSQCSVTLALCVEVGLWTFSHSISLPSSPCFLHLRESPPSPPPREKPRALCLRYMNVHLE